MRVDAICHRRDLPAVFDRWNELALADRRDGFFRTATWCCAWLEHVRPDAQPFVIVCRDASSGAIVGLAPLCRAPYRDLGLAFDALGWAGREVVSGDFLDVVAAPADKPRVAASVAEYLAGARSQWNLLVLGELEDGGSLQSESMRVAGRNGFAVRVQEKRICPYIELPDSFDGYLAGLGSATRYHIRRRTRDLQKSGAEFHVHSGPDAVAGRLQILTSLHTARWKSEGLPGTLTRPGFGQCLAAVCRNPPPGATPKLHMLTHLGNPVAALLLFQFGDSTLYYQAGWQPDSAVAHQSPAAVLMAESIREAIQSGSRFYEFLRGDEAYKSRWTPTYRTTSTVLIADCLSARAYLQAAKVKDTLKRSELLEPAFARFTAAGGVNS